MVLEAYHDEDANIQVWVTQEEFDDEDNPLYLVCSYTVPNPSADYTGTYDGEEEIECVYDVSLSDVPSTVSRLINNNNN